MGTIFNMNDLRKKCMNEINIRHPGIPALPENSKTEAHCITAYKAH